MAAGQTNLKTYVLEANQSKNNNTLTNVNHLVYPLMQQGADVYHKFDAKLYLVASASLLGIQGLKLSVIAPVTPYIRYHIRVRSLLSLALIGESGFSSSGGVLSIPLLLAGSYFVEISGTVASKGDESSDLRLQFAQNATDAGNSVTLEKGSNMIAHTFEYFAE